MFRASNTGYYIYKGSSPFWGPGPDKKLIRKGDIFASGPGFLAAKPSYIKLHVKPAPAPEDSKVKKAPRKAPKTTKPKKAPKAPIKRRR